MAVVSVLSSALLQTDIFVVNVLEFKLDISLN